MGEKVIMADLVLSSPATLSSGSLNLSVAAELVALVPIIRQKITLLKQLSFLIWLVTSTLFNGKAWKIFELFLAFSELNTLSGAKKFSRMPKH